MLPDQLEGWVEEESLLIIQSNFRSDVRPLTISLNSQEALEKVSLLVQLPRSES